MWIVLLTLLVPLVGVALLVLDAWRQTALPFLSRENWHRAVQATCLFAAITGTAIAVSAITTSVSVEGAWALSVPLLLILAAVVLATARQGFRLLPTWPQADEDGNAPEIIDRYTVASFLSDPSSARLRTGAWIMVLYPLLFVLPLVGMIGVVFVVLALITLMTVIQIRRNFEGQILWLLTIAVRHQISIADELENMSTGRGVKVRQRLIQAARDLRGGDPLWMVLDRCRLLTPSSISIIRIAEGGPRFEEALRRLALQTSQRMRIFNVAGLGDVLTQFLANVAAVLLVMTFLVIYIIPKFKMIFSGFDFELPSVTKDLISGTDYFWDRGFTPTLFWIGIGLVSLTWLSLRHIVGWNAMSIPLAMHFFPRRDAPEVMRALAGVVREPAILPQKLRELGQRRGRPDLGARYVRLADRIAAGSPLSGALYDEGIIDTLQRETLVAGERNSHLEFVLHAMADAIDHRELRKSATWSELIRPLSTLFCALIVGWVVLAFFLPLVMLLREYH